MNGPPILSVIASRSWSSEPRTFWASTLAPSRIGVTQERTFGVPSTCSMQLGQEPRQHRRPRGRWYLKLREKMRWPSAKSAEASVSPSNPRTGAPWKVKVTSRLRSMRSPCCGSSLTWTTGTSIESTSFVRVSRSAVNQASQPLRWHHHSRWTPAALRLK